MFLNPESRSVESEKWIVKCAKKITPWGKNNTCTIGFLGNRMEKFASR